MSSHDDTAVWIGTVDTAHCDGTVIEVIAGEGVSECGLYVKRNDAYEGPDGAHFHSLDKVHYRLLHMPDDLEEQLKSARDLAESYRVAATEVMPVFKRQWDTEHENAERWRRASVSAEKALEHSTRRYLTLEKELDGVCSTLYRTGARPRDIVDDLRKQLAGRSALIARAGLAEDEE